MNFSRGDGNICMAGISPQGIDTCIRRADRSRNPGKIVLGITVAIRAFPDHAHVAGHMQHVVGKHHPIRGARTVIHRAQSPSQETVHFDVSGIAHSSLWFFP